MLYKKISSAALILLFYPILSNGQSLIKKGVIDLRNYDFEREGTIPLDGEWDFAWETFASLSDTLENSIEVPGTWEKYSKRAFYNPDFGYCTYGLKIILPDIGKIWSIKLPPIHSAYKVYINNELKATVGTIAKGDMMTPAVKAQVIDFHNSQPIVLLRIQVSNFNFFAAGIWKSIEFGSIKSIRKDLSLSYFLSAFLIGTLVIMGFYHFGLFFMWTRDKGSLYFGLICFLVALRQCFNEQAYIYEAFPTIDYEWSLKVLYSIFPLCLIAFILFLISIYPNFSRIMKGLGIIVSIIFLSLVLSTSNTFYAKFLPFISLMFIIQSCYWMILIVKGAFKEFKQNLLMFIGILVLILTIINDILFERGVIDSLFLLPLGFVLFILFQSLLLALRFARASRKSETLSAQLIESNEIITFEKKKSEELKEIENMKSRFFSNITHEFRTPITLIITPVETLLKGPFSQNTVRKTLQTVLRSSKHLLHLINQLLDLAKLESKSMSINYYRGDVFSFIQGITESFSPIYDKANIQVEIESDLIRKEIIFDADKFEKIYSNLLSNSLKFTSKGGQISVQLTDLEQKNKFHLVVTDTGIGIDEHELPYVFDRFYQADKSLTRSFVGTGIGLSLVKELVELVGGSISVKSEKSKGTTFEVIFPYLAEGSLETLDIPALPGISIKTVSKNRPDKENESRNQEQATILVVEDNVELLDYMVESFTDRYTVLSATNGEEAWVICQSEMPDMIISDIMMPLVDGIELVQLVKGNELTNHIGIILLTAKGSQENKLKGLKSGANDYLAKPFSYDELNLKVSNAIQHQISLRNYYLKELKGMTPEESDQPINPFLTKVYEVIHTKLTDSQLNVEMIAQELAVSGRTLNRKLGSLIGLSTNDVVKNYRLKKSRELLLSGLNVSETAYKVGFESPSYFGQCFKELYQKSPKDFALQQGIIL